MKWIISFCFFKSHTEYTVTDSCRLVVISNNAWNMYITHTAVLDEHILYYVAIINVEDR